MSELRPVSALGGAARSEGLAVSVTERGLVGMATIRADLVEPEARAAIAAACAVPVPETRRMTGGEHAALLWMSPDELLFVTDYGEAGRVVADLETRLAGHHHMALDVSDARALFRLEGPGAREVVAKGAPVDLSARTFGPGDLRRSHLGQVAVAFWQVRENPETFDLVCFRSVAGYVFDWLCASAAEGGLPRAL